MLELGGSDPYVVLEDADLEPAAETCVSSRLINSGQSCIAAKRFIVVDAVRKRFEELFVEKMRRRRWATRSSRAWTSGRWPATTCATRCTSRWRASVRAGARLLLGGRAPAKARAPSTRRPCWPTCGKGMPAFDEEIFGPVAAIVPARDEEEAIRLANDSPFGLGAAVFTRDAARGERIAAEALEAGSCFVNALVRSDPRLPFGGIKESGYGRELSRLRHPRVREHQDRLRQIRSPPFRMDTQVLKPGGFWICPACGQRNKVWAPCSHCGTALSDMAVADDEPRAPAAGRRSPLLYALAAAGVAAAIALAFTLTRLLGGPALAPDDVPERAARDAARPIAPPAAPIAPATPQPAPPLTTLPQVADAAPPAAEAARPSEIAPSPPAAVYGPYGGLRSPGYSFPAPGGPRDEPGHRDGRAAGDLRAREQAVRTARDRFARAERALAAAEGGDADVEATAMEELDGAARELREAEAALDRARRRPPRS